MSKVSIIVPVYNVEQYLSECIESILNQSFRDYELILVDDGSTDKSGELCDAYAQRENVKVIHKQNGGLSSARNAGMDIAQGELLYFVDSDDFLSENGLSELVKMYDESGADVVIAQLTQDRAELAAHQALDYFTYDRKKVLELLFREKLNPSANCKLYRSALFNGIRFPEGLVYEDYATIPRVVDAADKIAVTQFKVYYYRPNPESITGVAFSPRRMQFFTVADMMLEFLQNGNAELIKFAKMRHTRYAISFYKQIAETDFHDAEIEKYLVGLIRKNIFRYWFTGYSVFSRAYGSVVAICPPLARKMMKK